MDQQVGGAMPMAIRWSGAVRFCLQFLIVILQALLFVWAGCAPVVWLVRDGLGPDSHESGWGSGLLKFAMQWGIPALTLAVPLFVLTRVEQKLGRSAAGKRTDL